MEEKMITPAWLLLIIVGFSTFNTAGSGVTSILVNEAQCKAALTIEKTGRTVVCVSPNGDVINLEKKQ